MLLNTEFCFKSFFTRSPHHKTQLVSAAGEVKPAAGSKNYTADTGCFIIYRVFHNILRDYKHLLQENRSTLIYKTCTDRRNKSGIDQTIDAMAPEVP